MYEYVLCTLSVDDLCVGKYILDHVDNIGYCLYWEKH